MSSESNQPYTSHELQGAIASNGTAWGRCLALRESPKCYRCDRCQFHRECAGELYSLGETCPGIKIQTRLTPTEGVNLDL